jgi:hypothetical protein
MNTKFRFKKAEIGVFKDSNSDLALNSFEKGCRILGLTNGEFSLIDLIYSVIKKIGRSRVIVATWSAGIKDVHQVKWMLDSELITDFKILTDHSYKGRQAKYAASIEDLFGIENIRTSEMHAKFVLIQNENYKVSITSSMNLNANKTCELFEIEEGDQTFDFLMSYVLHTFENMEDGFIESNTKVQASLKAFFNKTENIAPQKNWWDIGKNSE